MGEIYKAAGRKTYVVGNIGVAGHIEGSLSADDDSWLDNGDQQFPARNNKGVQTGGISYTESYAGSYGQT